MTCREIRAPDGKLLGIACSRGQRTMDEPSRHWRDNPNSAFSCRELRAGKFRLLAFDDGYWRIEISHHSIRACASDRLCESRTAAELAAEGVLRNLLDDALSFLNDGKTGR